jgi:hypothetical protein
MVRKSEIAIAVVLSVCAAAAQRLSEEEVNARAFELSGVRLGITQTQLGEVAPRARRLDNVKSGITGPFVPGRGQERWSIEARGRSSGVAYFEFIDSTLYAMSWVFPRAEYRPTVKSMLKTIGYAQRRTQDSQTWRFDAISRQIVVRKVPEGGVRISAIDFRRASDIIAYRDSVAAAGGQAPASSPAEAEAAGADTSTAGAAETVPPPAQGGSGKRDLDSYLEEQGW